MRTRKPVGKGPSQTQFHVISASANESPRRPASDGEQELVGGAIGSDSEGPRRSYSDVAASRPPSPTMRTFTQRTVDEIPMPPGRNPGLDRRAGEINGERTSTAAPVPAESPIVDTSEDEYPWTTVMRRRTQSSRIVNKKLNNSIDSTRKLTVEVQSAVQQAEQALTVAKKEQIMRRHQKVRNPHYKRSESRGEGASNLKGKHINPREWGNVRLSNSEADVYAQQAALESYRLAATKKSKENHREASRSHGNSKSHGKHRKNDLPAESRPIVQVPARSYIGVALKNIGRRSRTRDLPDDDSSESSSSSSESSESSDSSSDSESDSSRDVSSVRSHRHASTRRPRSHGHSSKKKKYNRKKSRRSGHTKAIKPNEYDGAADPRAYHRFIKESSAYLEDSGISRKRQCFALSYFLTDKAYDFYQQKVSMTEEKWTLEEFYTELFNFCFPINYRMEMRKKLDRLFQKEKSVNEYAFELEEIFNMIGGYSKRDKVIKLWNGFRRPIQAALWNDKLNPEISSWRKVLVAAEIIEIAEKVNSPSKEDNMDLYSESGSVVPSNNRKKYREKSKEYSKDSSRGGSNHASGNPSMSPTAWEDSNHSNQWHTSRDTHSQLSRGRGSHPRFGSTPRHEFIKKEPVDYGLSEKEKAARLATGRCFRCNGTGHISRDCPEENSVKHSGSKPPSAYNFNMEIIGENVPFDSNSAEVLDSLPLGHIAFDICDEMEQCDSQNISDSETSEFSGCESVLAVYLDMFDQELDEDLYQLPELQSVSETDSDFESQAAPEGGLYYNSNPLLANLEPNSLETKIDSLEPGNTFDFETRSDSGSSLGDLTGYELGKVGDILAWKAREVLTRCQPFPDDETEALPKEFFDGTPRFKVTRGEEFPDDDMYIIIDHFRGIIAFIHIAHLRDNTFSIGKWYAEICAKQEGDDSPSVVHNWMQQREHHETIMGAVREQYTADILEMAFAFEDNDIDRMDKRFDVQIECHDITHLVIHDRFRQIASQLPQESVEDPNFDLVNWYESRLAKIGLNQVDFTGEKIRDVASDQPTLSRIWNTIQEMIITVPKDFESGMEVNGVQVARDKYPAVQRNAASVKDTTRVLPKPVTLTVNIDGHPARALVDSGSLGDFMSTNLADQLKVKREELENPLGLQLAVQGSRSKINFRARSRFQYQGIDEERQFDVINLNNYDLILGTPWMYQHQVCLGFNPARVIIGTDTTLPIKKGADTKLMVQAIDVGTDELEQAREELRLYAEPLCKEINDTDLPPLRAINHTISLIDVNKKYTWRPSRRPEPFRAQWAEKQDAYLKTGRWKTTSSGNTTPMLLMPKPRKKDMPLPLRTVNDLRVRNVNIYKFTSPFPDMEGMSRRAVWKKFRSSMDLADVLSRMYSTDVPGTVHARSEYTYHDVDNDDLEIAGGDLPILAGLDAQAAVQRRPRRTVPGAETGCPETSREFDARVRNRFVLRGPVQRKEGEGTSTEKTISYEPRLTIRIKPTAAKNSLPPEMEGMALHAPTSPSNTGLADLVSSSHEGIDLLSELRKNYHKDTFFDLILKKLNEYCNFEVKDGQCINAKQTYWVAKLTAIEFAINSARSESTGIAPVFLISGRMPRSMVSISAPPIEFPSILKKELALMVAHDSILSARAKQTREANRKWQASPFNGNDLVYLSTENIAFPRRLARKLTPKYIGPYKILNPPQGDPQVFLQVGDIQLTLEIVPAKFYNSGDFGILFLNSPSFLLSIPAVASTSTMTKSSLPSLKRHSSSTNSDLPKPAALRTAYHSNIHQISDVLFIVTDTFASPVQHHLYPAAALYASLVHEDSIRDNPANTKDQPSPIRFDILARVYKTDARGTRRFAYFINAPSNPAVVNGDRVQPDDWNVTPAQRGLVIENPLFKQLLEEDAARSLRRKVTTGPSQIEKHQTFRSHKRDNDAIKQFHRTKADSKLKDKKKALVSLPITTTSQPVASGSAANLESLLSPVVLTSTSDITMSGPNAFSLTADEMLAFNGNTPSSLPKDTTFENDTPFDFGHHFVKKRHCVYNAWRAGVTYRYLSRSLLILSVIS